MMLSQAGIFPPVVDIAAIKLNDTPQLPEQCLPASLHTQVLDDLNQIVTDCTS